MHHELTPADVEQLLGDVDQLLRCARATAFESADNQRGDQRDHALAVVHLIEMARGRIGGILRGMAPKA